MFVVVDIFSRAMDISVNYLRPCCAFSGTGRLEPLSEAHSSARVVATHSKHFYDIPVSASGNDVLLLDHWSVHTLGNSALKTLNQKRVHMRVNEYLEAID